MNLTPYITICCSYLKAKLTLIENLTTNTDYTQVLVHYTVHTMANTIGIATTANTPMSPIA
jgi:hypothetical protein